MRGYVDAAGRVRLLPPVETPRSRGRCRVCGHEFALRADGTLRRHGGVSVSCPGSFTEPGCHIHRCGCGARWDEEVYG